MTSPVCCTYGDCSRCVAMSRHPSALGRTAVAEPPLKPTPWGPIHPLVPDGSPAFDVCACGDYRHQHVGPEGRGACAICGESARPADGCRRYAHWRAAETR